MQVLGYTYHNSGITIIATDGQYVIPLSHPNFIEIEGILDERWGVDDDLPIDDLVSIPDTINRRTGGKVTVNSTTGEVLYEGVPLHGAVVNHLLSLLNSGSSAFGAWTRFLEKLMTNPSYRAREQLYDFMSANGITINADGEILLYKKVRDDYYDVHTGRTFQYLVGTTHTMDRANVDDDPTRTCSRGIHVAAHSYMSCFGGERIVICAVDPADVVSIPVDYNNAKMRVAKLRVVAEHKSAHNGPTLKSAYMTDEEVNDYDDYYHDDQR